MAQLDIFCNFSKCRRSLNKVAWVTSCSHAFCEDHGKKEFVDSQKLPCHCPACNIPLGNKYDIVKVDLDPPEDFKSMVLAGLRPEILSDIFNRALTFWNYQICQEHMYQVVSLKKNKINLEKMSKYFESVEKKNSAQLESCEIALKNAEAEISALQQKAEDLISRLNAKSRQNDKIQKMYDSLRLNTLGSSMSDARDSPRRSARYRVAEDSFLKPHTPTNMRRSPDYSQRQSHSADRRRRAESQGRSVRPPDKGFVFRPVTPDVEYPTNPMPPPDSHSKRMRFERGRTPTNYDTQH